MVYQTTCLQCNKLTKVVIDGGAYNCGSCGTKLGNVYICDVCGMSTYMRKTSPCRYHSSHRKGSYWVKSPTGPYSIGPGNYEALKADDQILPKVSGYIPENPPWKKLEEVYDEELIAVKIALEMPPEVLYTISYQGKYCHHPDTDIIKTTPKIIDVIRKHMHESWVVRYVNRYPEYFVETRTGLYRPPFDRELHEHFYFDNGGYASCYNSIPTKPLYMKVTSIIRDFLQPPTKKLVYEFALSSLTPMSSRSVVGFDLVGLEDGNFALCYRYVSDSYDDEHGKIMYSIEWASTRPEVIEVGTELVFYGGYRQSSTPDITVTETGHAFDPQLYYIVYDDIAYRHADGSSDYVQRKSYCRKRWGPKYPTDVYKCGIYRSVRKN